VSGNEDFLMDSSQPNSVNNFGKSTNIIDVPMVDDDS